MQRVALEAVDEWEFEPCLLDGEPVGVIYSIVIDFDMSGKVNWNVF